MAGFSNTYPISSGPLGQFYIGRTFAASHYDIGTSDREYAFYVSIQLYGVALRLDKESPIIARYSKPLFSHKFTIGIEDPKDPKATL